MMAKFSKFNNPSGATLAMEKFFKKHFMGKE
jgi:hypothetical protein